MSTLTIDAATGPRSFMTKASALVAGTAFAGAALLGGTVVAPTATAALSGSVHHDYVLTADDTTDDTTIVTDFATSLQNLLDTLHFGTVGDVLGLFSTDSVDITTSSTLGTLLSTLNPDGLTLDDISGGLFSSHISALLVNVQVPLPDGTTASLGEVPIDGLIGGFIGGSGADESIGDVLGALGFGPYVGLLNLPFLGLSPDDTIADLLKSFLGIDGDDTLDGLVIGNGQTLGDATLGGLLGIDGDTAWDGFISNLPAGGGTIMDPSDGTLGTEKLGDLLTSLLGTDADPVTDGTEVTDILGGLGLFDMLGV